MHYAFSDGFPARSKSPLLVQALTGPNPGGLLQYRYKPAALPPGAPLLVILHGCGQSAAALDLGAGWSDLAERFGFALLAPEQSMSNNLGTCFNWFQPGDTARGQGEAASIRQMIAETVTDFASDPARIFITGLSAGGGMTSAMLAAYPEVFAAGAIIAGLPYGAASNMHEAMSAMHRAPARSAKDWGDVLREASHHKGAWPRISVWHGDADRTVGISNQDAIVAQWRDVLGLDAGPVETQLGTAKVLRWGDGRGPAKLESITVPGMGHGIPIKPGNENDACGEPAPFILDVGISSSFHIAEFFGLLQDAEKAEQKPEAKPKEPKLKAAAKGIAKAVLPRPMTPPPHMSLPHLMPIKLAPIKNVIVKALTVAGLIKKD
jgi:poly(hydroxyalkanoate) depolymerase family esterase